MLSLNRLLQIFIIKSSFIDPLLMKRNHTIELRLQMLSKCRVVQKNSSHSEHYNELYIDARAFGR